METKENVVPEKEYTPPCPHYKRCAGCQLQKMPYLQQLRFKQSTVQRLLGGYGKVRPIIGMENPIHYRNKVQAAFGVNRNKQIISGVYQSASHTLVSVDSCLIEDVTADKIIVTIRKMMPKFKMLPFHESTGKGFLRHVLVKRGLATGQVMVVLVSAVPIFPGRNEFVKELLRRHPEITTIVHNVNPDYHGLMLGKNEKVLYGEGIIEDQLCGCIFRISPHSFYQINPVQTQVLYNKAMEMAELSGKETVIDAYCGIGTIGLIAAGKAKHVIGIENNRDAVKDAIINVKRNHCGNMYVYQADAGEFMERAAADDEKADVVFMDPPRSGSDRRFLSAVVKLAPQKIIYISCNPQTQANDLNYLTGQGYRVQEIQPVDMFPYTNHVETVCLLVRRNGLHINIDVDVEEMLQEKRGQATYPQIKEYVLAQTGMKVSSLYVSQVKRKCGLDVSDSYNKPKAEDAHVPQCPPEKEKAIMEALAHFGLIS